MEGTVRTEEFKREIEKVAKRFGAKVQVREKTGRPDGATSIALLVRLVERPKKP